MKIVVVGAGGFIGRAVVDRLLGGALGELTSLTLLDLACPPRGGSVRVVEGSYADADVRAALFSEPADLVFHLASLAGGAAEADFEKGRSANLDGTLALFDAAGAAGGRPRIVYTSSIAALDFSRALLSPDDALRPMGSYGTHKAMSELYLADLSRRGTVDGRSVRPSGVVARPKNAYSGFATWWMNDFFRAAFEDRPITVPAAPESVIWLQSIAMTADNIIHAARLDAEGLPAHRSWTLPTTVASIAALAAALETQLGRPLPFQFEGPPMTLPAIDTADATAAGFASDGDAAQLVARILEQLEDER